jgi:hypothetical protein
MQQMPRRSYQLCQFPVRDIVCIRNIGYAAGRTLLAACMAASYNSCFMQSYPCGVARLHRQATRACELTPGRDVACASRLLAARNGCGLLFPANSRELAAAFTKSVSLLHWPT